MAQLLPNCPSRGTSGFQQVVRAFHSSTGLPFAEVLSAERIERVFRKHRCDFGQRGIYSAAVMLWSFLSQVLRDGKEAACQAAVARVISYCHLNGLGAPTVDTGDYRRRRKGVRTRPDTFSFLYLTRSHPGRQSSALKCCEASTESEAEPNHRIGFRDAAI